jgi:hypothetical protein
LFDPRALYSIEISTIPGFKALGINVQWGSRPDEDGDWLGFHDTCRGHDISGHLIRETADGFIWQRKTWDTDAGQKVNDGELIFRVLTLERFKEEFLPKVVGPIPDFNSTEDLWEWYRRRYADAGGDYY